MLQSRAQHEYLWQPQPAAAEYIRDCVDRVCARNKDIERWRRTLPAETGTRLIDWIDQLVVPNHPTADVELVRVGYEFVPEPAADDHVTTWQHHEAMLPAVRIVGDAARHGHAPYQLYLKVDSVEDFLVTHSLESVATIDGPAGAPWRQARVADNEQAELWIVERHGWPGYVGPDVLPERIDLAAKHLSVFRARQRLDGAKGFAVSAELIESAVSDLGQDWTCALFFRCERDYWQSRNSAARVQFERQNRVGMGWANHDHHTYRCSREHFYRLIGQLERMGFFCRERFYAGDEAGWGAQVLDHPNCNITVFADVDLSAEEVSGDFSHYPLSPRESLGTVGLWCALHGESFLAAGMHHLECQFDFNAIREQLAKDGIKTMAPFTDFEYLKQAFTEGERWTVKPDRVAGLVVSNKIDRAQAETFRSRGAIGSHLEILQRDDGYKGFNQTGISDIIARTDPRRQ